MNERPTGWPGEDTPPDPDKRDPGLDTGTGLNALESFRIEHLGDPGREHGTDSEEFALSYTLDGTEHSVTFDADNAEDVDVLTDGSSVFVLTTSLQRETVGLAVFTRGRRTATVRLQSGDATRVLGQDVWHVGSEEMVRRMVALSPEACNAPPSEAAGHAPDGAGTARSDIREVLSTPEDSTPHVHLELEPIRVWSEWDFTLELLDTGKTDRDGKAVLAYRLLDAKLGPEPVFEGADFHCSPLHAVDSDRTVASLLGFLSLRPGDTDREHFDDYTARQLEWCQRRGEELSMLAHELEQPYRPLRGARIGHESWEEAGRAGRYNRALTLEYLSDQERHRVTLNGGESDTIDVLTDGQDVYVVTTNSGLGYVGLEVFSAGAPAGDLFIDGSEVEESFGDDVWDLGTSELLEKLIEYLPDRDCPLPSESPARFPSERERIEQVLAGLDGQTRERIHTFLRIGRQNPWIRQAWDPPFSELSFHICKDLDELVTFILRGNWCLGQSFVLGDICFINQVNGGDEWLTIKGATSFESITMRTATESHGSAEQRLRETVKRIQAASEEDCRRLDY